MCVCVCVCVCLCVFSCVCVFSLRLSRFLGKPWNPNIPSTKKRNFRSSRLDERSSGLYEKGVLGQHSKHRHSKNRHWKHRHWTSIFRVVQCRHLRNVDVSNVVDRHPLFPIARNSFHRTWNSENSTFSLMMDAFRFHGFPNNKLFALKEKRLNISRRKQETIFHTHTQRHTHTHTHIYT